MRRIGGSNLNNDILPLHPDFSGIDLDQSANMYHVNHSLESSETPFHDQEADFHESVSQNGNRTTDRTSRRQSEEAEATINQMEQNEIVYENRDVLNNSA